MNVDRLPGAVKFMVRDPQKKANEAENGKLNITNCVVSMSSGSDKENEVFVMSGFPLGVQLVGVNCNTHLLVLL